MQPSPAMQIKIPPFALRAARAASGVETQSGLFLKLRILAVIALWCAMCGGITFAAMPQRPALHVATLDGKTFDLAAQRGRWVIVNYWATWCSPCIAEMPAISKFVETHEDVTAIGLVWDDSDRKDVVAFVKQHPVAYPIAQVDTDKPPRDFETPRGLPNTYLIAPDGSVAKHFVGPVDEASLAKAIAAAKAGAGTAAPAKPHGG